jgi:formate dehydrogenase iron-sulfur subunit
MCTDRLAVGEAPACVQACPHEAITIRFVDVAEIAEAAQPGSHMIPGAFGSDYTKPTTQYFSRKRIPDNSEPADAHALQLEHAHWPLIIMLLLSQMAAGIFLAAAATGTRGGEAFAHCAAPLATVGFLALNAGLGASVFHLGRPLGAWRFFLGLRTSWMSREILAFGLFAGAAFVTATLCWALPGSLLGLAGLTSAAVIGLLAVFTSVMIYADTRRAFWALPQTAARFYGTVTLLGVTAAATVIGGTDSFTAADLTSAFRVSVLFAMVVRTLFFGWELWAARRALRDFSNPSHRCERKIRALLPWLTPARVALFVAATACSMAAIMGTGASSTIWSSAALAATIASQILERFSFFTAVSAPRMPGGV